MCHELLPERISLDEWGYPILDGSPLDPALLAHARRAAAACPTLALLVERVMRAEGECLPASAEKGTPTDSGMRARRVTPESAAHPNR